MATTVEQEINDLVVRNVISADKAKKLGSLEEKEAWRVIGELKDCPNDYDVGDGEWHNLLNPKKAEKKTGAKAGGVKIHDPGPGGFRRDPGPITKPVSSGGGPQQGASSGGSAQDASPLPDWAHYPSGGGHARQSGPDADDVHYPDPERYDVVLPGGPKPSILVRDCKPSDLGKEGRRR